MKNTEKLIEKKDLIREFIKYQKFCEFLQIESTKEGFLIWYESEKKRGGK